ncbi:hypothetical protein HGRIS_012855 [Hohenbuehelia grisea]|uniref:Ribosomal protein S13 n=1 Tax=Hohenbuehelia grisea TaxID=104357 RepID=A0ABR3ITK1_9AGAR
MHILGINLPDSHLTRFALTNFYGVGHKTAHRICARLQIHDRCKVKNLTPFQVTALSSFLSSPGTVPPIPRLPLASKSFVAPPPNTPVQPLLAKIEADQAARKPKSKAMEALSSLKIESELRREIRENIGHQRMIGSYVGKRHAMHLPVRGQNTQTNAKTARRLNKLERH